LHLIIYSYYAITAAFPEKYIWWKKHLTGVQMVQFFIALYMTIVGLYVDCPFPKWISYGLALYMFSLILLFSNFWSHAYKSGVKKLSATGSRSTKSASSSATNGYLKQTANDGLILSDCLQERNGDAAHNGDVSDGVIKRR